jgi:uncharacterized membrane protein YvbJ
VVYFSSREVAWPFGGSGSIRDNHIILPADRDFSEVTEEEKLAHNKRQLLLEFDNLHYSKDPDNKELEEIRQELVKRLQEARDSEDLFFVTQYFLKATGQR